MICSLVAVFRALRRCGLAEIDCDPRKVARSATRHDKVVRHVLRRRLDLRLDAPSAGVGKEWK